MDLFEGNRRERRRAKTMARKRLAITERIAGQMREDEETASSLTLVYRAFRRGVITARQARLLGAVVAVALALVAGCATTLAVPTTGDPAPVSQAELRASWTRTFGDPLDNCPDIDWLVMPLENVHRLCSNENAIACIYTQTDHPVSFIAEEVKQFPCVWAHESAHEYLQCTKGDPDHDHTRQDVFGPHGFEHFFGACP